MNALTVSSVSPAISSGMGAALLSENFGGANPIHHFSQSVSFSVRMNPMNRGASRNSSVHMQ